MEKNKRKFFFSPLFLFLRMAMRGRLTDDIDGSE